MKKITHLPFNGIFNVTYPFGVYDPNLNVTNDKKHHGIDLTGNDGVYSTCEGKVIFVGNDKYLGNYVVIKDENNLNHYFCHLSSYNVSVNANVTYTTKIGLMGATGYVTGPHLHYEIRNGNTPINPTEYMKIPNNYGKYNANDYLIEIEDNIANPDNGNHKYSVGQLVVYSSCYRGKDDTPPNYIDCIVTYGAWQQRNIVDIVDGKNPYRLDNGMYLNDGDIREVK